MEGRPPPRLGGRRLEKRTIRCSQVSHGKAANLNYISIVISYIPVNSDEAKFGTRMDCLPSPVVEWVRQFWEVGNAAEHNDAVQAARPEAGENKVAAAIKAPFNPLEIRVSNRRWAIFVFRLTLRQPPGMPSTNEYWTLIRGWTSTLRWRIFRLVSLAALWHLHETGRGQCERAIFQYVFTNITKVNCGQISANQ